ncbi:MAG: nucleotide exchange factor GrpE, partial [Treponema maltophilum]
MSTKETKHKENEETVTENPQTASETQSADANGQTSKEQTAEERIAALEAENADLQDKYLRKSADFENYRKRMVKEKQEI